MSEQVDAIKMAKVPEDAYLHEGRLNRFRACGPWLLAFAAVVFLFGERLWHNHVRYSPGPVASVHSIWGENCAACHDNFTPLDASNWTTLITSSTHAADAKCSKCHVGPAHHANEAKDAMPGCTDCHREHQGERGKLLEVADTQCVRCHRNLAVRVADKSKQKARNVADLKSHVDFAVHSGVPKDPGTVRFTHGRHLTLGLNAKFTFGKIASTHRGLYQGEGVGDDALVQLDCASCHRESPDPKVDLVHLAGLPANALHPARPSGARMLPIVFEQHCQGCHPLTYKDEPAGGVRRELRHRLQPKELAELLRASYYDDFLIDKLDPLRKSDRTLPLDVGLTAEQKKKRRAEVAVKVDRGLENLFKIVFGETTCKKCHPNLDAAKGADQIIPPANVPDLWLKSARFDHVSHRGVECKVCHPLANADNKTENEAILLPHIEVCRQCHGPTPTFADVCQTGVRHGGAKHRCIDCHDYHAVDHPRAGRGNDARRAKPREIVEFLTNR